MKLTSIAIVAITLFVVFTSVKGQDLILTPEQIIEKKSAINVEFEKMDEIIKQAEDRKLELRGQFQVYLELEKANEDKE